MTKELRNFGLTLGTVFAAFGAWFFYRQQTQAIYFLILSLVFLLPALISPQILRPLHFIWMKLSDILGFIMTRVILTTLFYLVITPISLILRLTGKDLLNLKFESEAKSYWLTKKSKLDKASFLKQY